MCNVRTFGFVCELLGAVPSAPQKVLEISPGLFFVYLSAGPAVPVTEPGASASSATGKGNQVLKYALWSLSLSK